MANLQNLETLISKLQEDQQQNSTARPVSKFINLKVDIMNVRNYLFYSYEEQVQRRCKTFIPDDQTRIAINYAALWLFSPKRDGLLLYGEYGNGKSTMLTCLKWLFLKDRMSDRIIMTTPNMIIRDMSIPTNEGRLFDRCFGVDVLIIDEVGSEEKVSTIWGTRCTPIQDILVYRYDRKLITILASNLDDEGLLQQYGPRVMDRICESYTRISYSQESYRTSE